MKRLLIVPACVMVAVCAACESGGADAGLGGATSVVVSVPSVASIGPDVRATTPSTSEVTVPADRKLPPYSQMCSDLRQVFELGGGNEAAGQFIATVEASDGPTAAGVRWAELSAGEQSEFKRAVYAAANNEC